LYTQAANRNNCKRVKRRGSLLYGVVITAVMSPSHHGMARYQVVDEGTATNIEGNCEYIEQAVAESR